MLNSTKTSVKSRGIVLFASHLVWGGGSSVVKVFSFKKKPRKGIDFCGFTTQWFIAQGFAVNWEGTVKSREMSGNFCYPSEWQPCIMTKFVFLPKFDGKNDILRFAT